MAETYSASSDSASDSYETAGDRTTQRYKARISLGRYSLASVEETFARKSFPGDLCGGPSGWGPARWAWSSIIPSQIAQTGDAPAPGLRSIDPRHQDSAFRNGVRSKHHQTGSNCLRVPACQGRSTSICPGDRARGAGNASLSVIWRFETGSGRRPRKGPLRPVDFIQRVILAASRVSERPGRSASQTARLVVRL